MLCGWCVAQDSNPNSTPQAQQPSPEPNANTTQTQEQPRRIAPGSVIPVQLSKTVDAKKAKVGDEVEAKVTQDMKAVNGQILVAKDTKMVGHVTEAQPRTKDQKESQVGITFDKAVAKDGSSSSLPMSIQAVIAPQNPNDNSGASSGGGSAPSSAAPSGSSTSAGNSGRSGMGAQTSQQAQPSYPSGDQSSANAGTGSARPPITANTKGIVGIPDYELSAGGDQAQGSIVKSEKGNVKLESGTLLLLRVNQ
jgi:hypothetical protein